MKVLHFIGPLILLLVLADPSSPLLLAEEEFPESPDVKLRLGDETQEARTTAVNLGAQNKQSQKILLRSFLYNSIAN